MQPTKCREVMIDGPSGEIEGLLEFPLLPHPGHRALICHPHPKHGGNMHHKVVDSIARTLRYVGYTTLRFNFRGVGKSEGEFDNGEGECDDAFFALRAMLALPDSIVDDPLSVPKVLSVDDLKPRSSQHAIVAGFSFGAWIALRLAARLEPIRSVLSVGNATLVFDYDKTVSHVHSPIAFVQGELDTLGSAPKLLSLCQGFQEAERRLFVVPGANHTFDGFQYQLRHAMAQAFQESDHHYPDVV